MIFNLILAAVVTGICSAKLEADELVSVFIVTVLAAMLLRALFGEVKAAGPSLDVFGPGSAGPELGARQAGVHGVHTMFGNGIFSEGIMGGAEKAVFDAPAFVDPSSPLMPRSPFGSGYQGSDLGSAESPLWGS